jgi:hypothetical protein
MESNTSALSRSASSSCSSRRIGWWSRMSEGFSRPKVLVELFRFSVFTGYFVANLVDSKNLMRAP